VGRESGMKGEGVDVVLVGVIAVVVVEVSACVGSSHPVLVLPTDSD